MLLTLSNLRGSRIQANDGEAGVVKDVLFDDRFWTIRFIVVDTKPWFAISDKVLISPISILNFNAEEGELRVSLTKESIKNSPKVEEFEPVSRKFEKQYFDFFGYGYYWAGSDIWGDHAYPTGLTQRQNLAFDSMLPQEEEQDSQSAHLRSAHEMHHYDIHALDSQKGHVEDFVWDLDSWSLRHIVIDTRDWLPGGKKVLLSPEQLGEVSWEEQSVECKMTRDKLKACPEYGEGADSE